MGRGGKTGAAVDKAVDFTMRAVRDVATERSENIA
jgi:hypothetical protein